MYILCHDHDIPPQPSHTYSCLLAIQTPPKQSLTPPKPIPGLPDPSIAFPNPFAAFLKYRGSKSVHSIFILSILNCKGCKAI